MRQKTFMIALVAMLSFAFSAFAQTAVTSGTDLKNALSSTGAVVTLDDNITMNEVISIPDGVTVTLDLNGKSITGKHSGYVFDVTGSLTIKDSKGGSTVTGNSRVLNIKSKGKVTLNGGKFFKRSGQVIYTSGKLVVDGGVVETAPNATLNVNTAAITGAGGTVELKSGTVTSVVAQFCNLTISGSDATVTSGLNIYKGAKGANITAGTIKGDVTIAPEIKNNVNISGGNFEDTDAIKEVIKDGSAFLQKPDGTYEIVAGLLKIGDTYYPTLDAAFAAAKDGAIIELINQEGAVIAMNGSLYGKKVTITGKAKVDWSKGFLFVGRGGAGDATLTFDKANLTSVSNSSSYGIHVSGREKDTNNKYDGTLVIKNSDVELDYLINRGTITLEGSALTVKNGFGIAGRPAKETENNQDATATITLNKESKLVVNNHNGMGIGQASTSLEGYGIMNIDETSTFKAEKPFRVTANGTMNVAGNAVVAGTLTNNGAIVLTNANASLTSSECGNVTTNVANKVVSYNNGAYKLIDVVAKIGEQGYISLQAAIDAAKAGETVTILAGTYKVPAMKAGIKVEGAVNADGTPAVLLEGTLSNTLENLTLKNLHIKGGNAQRWAYAKGDLVFENVIFDATSVYAIHFDGIAANTNLTYKNCTIIGWAAMGGTPESCVFDGCTIKGNGTYGLIRTYFDATIKDCTFDVSNVNTNDVYQDGIHAVEGAKVVVTNCTNANGDMKDIVNVHATSKVTVDGVVYENVAKVGDKYYATLVEAFAAVGDGAGKKVELIANVDLASAEWTPVNFNGEFDGQGHTISNLVVNGAGKSNQGFFAQTQNGEIKNVTFNNAKVTGRLNVGVVAGTPYTSKYTNVKVTGHVEVNGMAYVGGVGGKNAYANWTDITVDVNGTSYVKATSTENGTAYRTYVGGVIGFNGEGGHTFKNISSNIKVIGDVMDIGGIFGILHYGNNAENITFTGAVEAPAEAKEVGGIAGVWHNEKGQAVTITNAKSEGTVKVGDVSTTGSIVGGAYNADNKYEANSGSLIIDGNEAWLPRKVTTKGELDAAIAAAEEGDIIVMDADIDYGTGQLAIAKAITLDLGGKTLTTRNAFGGMSIKGNPTVKNGNIVHASNTAAIKVWNATAFEDLVIDVQGKGDANKTIGGIVLQSGSTTKVGSIKNVTIKGAALTNGIETYNCGDATENVIGAMENVTIDAQGTGLLISAPCGTATNCDIKGGVNAVEIFIKGNYSASLDLVDSKVEGGVYAHDEFSTNPDIVNNGTLKFTANEATTGADAADVTLEIARAEAEKVQGVLNDVMVNAKAKLNNVYYATFAEAFAAAKAGDTLTLLADLNMSEILVLDKAITLDGNGKTLTSTAGRAINVDCEGNVGIKNLTINASGERAINIIQKPANVTIENVTATAANYTVNLAATAGAAKVAISNSNLTGLNVVNVAAAGSEITINGGTITCNDQNANENYAALAMNKDAVGAKIAATGVTFDIKGDSKKASNGAVDGVITIDGKTDEVAVNVAYIGTGDYYYAFTSIEAAIEAANAGQTIGLIRDITASDIITIDKAITLDGNGKKLTSTAGRAINVSGADGATIKNLTIDAKGERAINIIQNATNVTIEKVTATAANYTVNVAASAPNAVVAINNSTLNGLCTVNVSAAGAKVTVDKSTVNCNDNNTTAGEAYAALCLNKEAVGGSIVATNSTVNVTEGSDSMEGRNGAEKGTVTINGSTEGVAVMVAAITYPGSDYYHAFATLEKAIEFAKAGDVVTLIRDITTSAQININKNVAIDGCDKKLTVKAARGFQITGGAVAISNLTIDMPNAAEGNRGINLYNGDTNAALDVTLNNVTINGGKAYAVNIGGGKDNKLTINGSTLTGYAAINVHTSSVNHTIVVDGSTLNGKNHNNNYSFGTVVVDGTNAHSLTITNTTITTENLEGVTSKYDKVVVSANCTLNWNGGEAAVRSILADSKGGKLYYTDLQAAINDAAEVSGTVQILGNITATKSIAIPAAKKVTIDLNGKTITGTDNETKSYGLININPGAELTINDATGNGAIKLTATNDRDWNAYSSVISNQRGKLTVNGGTIEHLGGTDMAYAIDNLTNTGAQKAETVINGGVIKSTYRAIRQFLNSTSAQNILTVNGGTIEGANKSIWMQEANANANNGTLTVAAAAAIKGDVYLSGNAAAKEWPVNVAVAAAALQGESKVLTSNVPAGYDLANVDGIYGIYSGAAKIGTTYYATVDAAIKAAKAGDTVNILAGTYKVPAMKAGITVEGAVNADGTPAVLLEGTLSNTLENLTLKNLHIRGGNAQRWAYAKGNLVFENVIFDATSVYAIHFDGIAAGTNLTYKNCTIIGWAAMGGTPESCVFDGCTIKGNGTYGLIRTYFDATIKDCTFDVANVNTNDNYQDGIHAVEGAEVVVDSCTNVNGTMKDLVNIHGTSEVTVDGVVYKNVAKVGDKNYITIEDAFAAWADGTTLTLLTDIALDTKTLATQNDGYAAIVNVADKAVTLDLNGKKITVNAAAADLAGAKGGMLLAVFSADLGGHLTLTDNSDAKNGAVTLNVNDAKVYSMFASESKESDKINSGKITVNGGKYTTVGKVSNAMFFADANEVITVNGGNFHCDGASTTAGYPWMFNTVGNNELHVTVNGGTFNVDINHQHRPFEVKVPETLAVKANDNGTWTVVPAEAYITEMLGATVNEAGEWGHKVGYATIAEAIAAVNELGNKVSIANNLELTETVVVPADKTMVLDLNGKTVTMNDASGAAAALLKNNGNLTITDDTEAKAGKLSFKTTTPSAANAYASNTISNYGTLTIESGNVENLSVGGGACYALDNYAGSTATINGGKLTAEKTAVRIFNWTDGEAAKATINMNGGEIYSKNGYGINVNSGNAPFVALNIAGGTITTDYADYKLAVYVVNKGTAENFTANVTGGTFNGIFALNGVTAQTMKQGAVAVSGGTFEGVTCYEDPAYGFVSGGTFKSAVDAKAVATGFICKDNGDGTFGVIVDPKHGMVAQIIRNDYYAENQYFATINDAVQAAVTGETVTLIADVETSAAGYATIGEENYAVIVAVKEKDITLNLNGKSVTVTPTAEELANAEGKMLMSVFGMDTNGKLTLAGNGSVKVNANGANVYSLATVYGEGGQLTIESGNYEADAVIASGSLIYAQQANCITVSGGNFKLGNLATGSNGSPWIFNTKGQNYTGVKVLGGTYPTDINHQFWANEVYVPEHLALQKQADDTWKVVEAVAYTNELATSRNASWRHVGYASLEDAIAATGKYNCQDNTVTMIKDITLEPITIANGVKVAIDLNGKTITGKPAEAKAYAVITNKGDLTIKGTGSVITDHTLAGSTGYAVNTITNCGTLTIDGATIENKSTAQFQIGYAIDNNSTSANATVTIVSGKVIASGSNYYDGIRLFCNSMTAENNVIVNGGEVSTIWMQNPSDGATKNTKDVMGSIAINGGKVGVLSLEPSANFEAAVTGGHVGEISYFQAAEGRDLVDFVTGGTFDMDVNDFVYDPYFKCFEIENGNGYIVERVAYDNFTIIDSEYEEFTNTREITVFGNLTYERDFADTEWQTIYLPFDVPVANLMDEFEVAYIYNASYKNNAAEIDYVVIDDSEFVLAANYPYMIRAKEAEYKYIVVNEATLMPTAVETIDCSSVFETFRFIGSYGQNIVKNENNAYVVLNSGIYKTVEDDAVNPFRFYLEIASRKVSNLNVTNFDVERISMRSVGKDGEANGIDSVRVEQNDGFIFDLYGRRVLEPQKGGIYIMNGKKVIF